jgi:hypothetical protein
VFTKHNPVDERKKEGGGTNHNVTDSDEPRKTMSYRMTYSRLIGALFITGFVVYGAGFGLTSSVIGVPNFFRRFLHIRPPWSSEPF